MRVWLACALILCACGDDASGPGGGGGQGIGGEAGAEAVTPDAGLPSYACAAGELEIDGGCLPAGILPEACGAGFTGVDMACEPILPADPCGPGTMALPGDTTCSPVAPCQSGTWGDIPIEVDSEHVDQGFSGTSDGSAAAPWTTIQAAIDAAEDGAIVAIAAGSYAESLTVNGKAVRLWGVCPDDVSIVSANDNAVRLQHAGSELRSVAVSAPNNIAVQIANGATNVVVEGVRIHDSGLIGIDVSGANPSATIRRCLIEDQMNMGVYTAGAQVTVEDTVIRDVRAGGNGDFGQGIRAWADDQGVPSTFTLRHSMVDGALIAGVDVRGATASIEDVVVRRVVPSENDDLLGCGICVYASPYDNDMPSDIAVSRSHVSDTYLAAILVVDSTATVHATTMRDVHEHPVSPASYGLFALRLFGSATPMTTLSSSLIENTRLYGVSVVDSDMLVEAVLVRDTQPVATTLVPGGLDVGGRGIGVEVYQFPEVLAHLTARGVRVERVHEGAIMALGADLDLESAYVGDVASRDTDGQMGRGIDVHVAMELDKSSTGRIEHVLVERASEHGIMVGDSEATIVGAHVRDTRNSMVGQFGRGIGIQGTQFMPLRSTVSIDRSLVEASAEVGIFSASSDVTVTHTIVRNSTAGSGLFGDGITGAPLPPYGYEPSALTLREVIVENSQRAGVGTWGGGVTLESSLLVCNGLDLVGEAYSWGTIQDEPFAFDDLGGNACVCGSERRDCKVLSSSLEPPLPADH